MARVLSFTRRRFCSVAAAAAAAPLRLFGFAERSNTMAQVAERMVRDKTTIRPFPHLNVPHTELDDLRRRVSATRWPERETVPDTTQGVPLAMIRELARH